MELYLLKTEVVNQNAFLCQELLCTVKFVQLQNTADDVESQQCSRQRGFWFNTEI